MNRSWSPATAVVLLVAALTGVGTVPVQAAVAGPVPTFPSKPLPE